MNFNFDYEERIEECLSELIGQGNTSFILYPFGLRGKTIKSILNAKYGISEKLIIDNKLCTEYKNIYPLNELRRHALEDVLVLVTSDAPQIHEELLEKLYSVVPKEKCIDVFSDFVIKQYKENKAEQDRKNRVEKKGGRAGMTYHPKNTNSTFALPYVYMEFIQQSIFLSDDYNDRRSLDRVFCDFRNGIIKDMVSRSDSTVIDAGANIGNHTLFFCNEMKASKVIAFEPVVETFRILEDNIRLNHLEDTVEIRNEGLSDVNGNAEVIGMSYSNMGGVAIRQDSEGTLNIIRLDDLNLSNVVFMKIDVEGMEVKALRGAYETIKRNKPYIMIESFDDNFPETKELLNELGYEFIILSQGSDYLFYYRDAV